MNLFQKIKNTFSSQKSVIFKQSDSAENAGSTAFADKTGIDESDWEKQGTSNVPGFSVEELSYVLECESRRYSSELSL